MAAGCLRRLLLNDCSSKGLKKRAFVSTSGIISSSSSSDTALGIGGREEDHVDKVGVAYTPPGPYSKYYRNRNPRNLELLGMAPKPLGYATRVWRVDYYHRLMLELTNRHVSAYVNHNSGLKVAKASTKEFAISRHLYKTNDVAAAYNVGRVLADRCKETGIYRMTWEHKRNRNAEKVKFFLKAFSEAGIILNEPKVRLFPPPPGKLPL